MRKSRLEKATIQQLIEHFVAGTPAHATAYLCGIHRNTARKWHHQFRVLIVQGLEKEHTIFESEVALDERYFEKNKLRKTREWSCRKNSSVWNI